MIIQSSNNKNLLLILLISAALTSCDPDEKDEDAYEQKAKSDAGMVIHEIPLKYLGCYALEPELKKQCAIDLSKKHISQRLQKVPEYVQAFQFEAEKLGFKYFLISEGLECNSIIDGPEFEAETKAYKVRCMLNTKYYMRFDYTKSEWLLVNKNE